MSIFEKVIDSLNRTEARYVVVGQVAGVLHGYDRFTSDLDLTLDFAPRSIELLAEALSKLGLKPRVPIAITDLADSSKRTDWINNKNAKVITLYHPAFPAFAVDILLCPTVPFDELFAQSKLIPIGTISARIASLPHLIRLKEGTGREKDETDIKKLRVLLERQK